MSATQLHDTFPAFVEGWKRRSFARTALSALVSAVMIVVFGAADGAMGYFLFVLVAGVCVGDLAYSRRQASTLSRRDPSDWLTLNQREQNTLRVGAMAGYLPAIAVVIKVARHSCRPVDGVALAFFIAVALFAQFVLLRSAQRSGAVLRLHVGPKLP